MSLSTDGLPQQQEDRTQHTPSTETPTDWLPLSLRPGNRSLLFNAPTDCRLLMDLSIDARLAEFCANLIGLPSDARPLDLPLNNLTEIPLLIRKNDWVITATRDCYLSDCYLFHVHQVTFVSPQNIYYYLHTWTSSNTVCYYNRNILYSSKTDFVPGLYAEGIRHFSPTTYMLPHYRQERLEGIQVYRQR